MHREIREQFHIHAKSLGFIATLAEDDLEGEMLRARLAKHRVDGDLVQPAEGAEGPAHSPPSES